MSGLGSYVTVFSLQALVVLMLHGTATDVGWLDADRWLPYLVLGLVVAAWSDRTAWTVLHTADELHRFGDRDRRPGA